MEKVIIDTSIWLLACARKTTGDEMSRVDRQINEISKSQNVKKYRGALARLLVNYDVIIPDIVLKELKDILTAGILDRSEIGNLGKLVHQQNKKDLEFIINSMEGLTTEATPTRNQVIRQAAIWERIRLMPDQTNRWDKKFKPQNNRVKTAAEKAKLTNSGEEPWLHARKMVRLKREQFEKEFTPQLSKEIGQWEEEMKKTWPDLIPDYEILLVSESTNAPIVSRDKDYKIMWLASPELSANFNINPKIVTTIDDTQEKRNHNPKPRRNHPETGQEKTGTGHGLTSPKEG